MLLLGFIGITAILGGSLLMYDSDGSTMGMSYSNLSGSPFNSYYLPGLLLLTIIGIGSWAVCVLTYRYAKNYAYYIMAFGVILILFIILQVIFLEAYGTLHTIYILLALLLLLLGNLIRKQSHVQHSVDHKTPAHSPAKRSAAHHHGSHKHKRK